MTDATQAVGKIEIDVDDLGLIYCVLVDIKCMPQKESESCM